MGRISDLLMFANPSDIRRAVRNPQKATRVAKKTLFQSPSSTDPVQNPRDEIREAIADVLEVPESEVAELFGEAEQFEREWIEPRLTVFSDKQYEPGGMSIGGKSLYVLTRLTRPNRILEIGVANGMSTAYMLAALRDEEVLPDEVTIHGIDRPQFEYQVRERRGRFGVKGRGGIIPNDKEVGWLASPELKSRYNYNLHVGDFVSILPDVVETVAGFDLALYDASKDREEMQFAYESCIERLQSGGILVSDDILVNDAFGETTSKYDGITRAIGDTGLFRRD